MITYYKSVSEYGKLGQQYQDYQIINTNFIGSKKLSYDSVWYFFLH